jgi:hypothetical protein
LDGQVVRVVDQKYLRNSLSSPSSSASGFSASILSDDEAGDSELKVFPIIVCMTLSGLMREALRSAGIGPSNENEEQNDKSFFTARPRLGLADSLEKFH